MRFLRIKSNYKIVVLLLFCIIGQSFAQYEISKFTINSGGGVSEFGNFKISGSVGQVDASTKSTGGGFSITGGFWHEKKRAEDMFSDGFE